MKHLQPTDGVTAPELEGEAERDLAETLAALKKDRLQVVMEPEDDFPFIVEIPDLMHPIELGAFCRAGPKFKNTGLELSAGSLQLIIKPVVVVPKNFLKLQNTEDILLEGVILSLNLGNEPKD